MKAITKILFITILVITKLAAQSNYGKYVVADSLKKTHKVKNTDGGFDKINYLGAIKKANGDTLYHVFSIYSGVQAAIVMHWHSNIVYLSKKFKEVKSYEAGGQEELPYKLKDNTLYFKYIDEKSGKKAIFKNKVGTTPPTIMCIAPNNCL